MKEPDFLVRVNCMTYNHSNYIQDALDGFCMQQTNFPFICTIIDDASTDGEPEVLKSYLNNNFDVDNKDIFRNEKYETHALLYAQHKENKNCYFAVILLNTNHYSIRKSKQPYAEEWRKVKYYAPCEGDDFWTSPCKLQRQLDFMESHPNHSLCFHANYSLFSNGTQIEHFQYFENVEEVPMKDIILGGGGFMATNSIFFLQKFRYNWPKWAQKSPVGDVPLTMILAISGKYGYINEVMSCYRVAAEGSWTERISRNKKQSKEHNKKIIGTWKEFDKWTDFKYHKLVNKKIRKIKLHFLFKRYSLIEKTVKSMIKISKRILR